MLSAIKYGRRNTVNLLLELGAQPEDEFVSAWAEKFLDGTYPLRSSPEPQLGD